MLNFYQNIDVDQIVLAHYQATTTPDDPSSKSSPFTPFSNGGKDSLPRGSMIPSELKGKCIHNVEVCALHLSSMFLLFLLRGHTYFDSSLGVIQMALCTEAREHLQEMKDKLISISNKLLDDADDLSPQHFEKLRQERFVLVLSEIMNDDFRIFVFNFIIKILACWFMLDCH